MEAKLETRKKPQFLRTDWNRKPRFSMSRKVKWRRARGRHSKIRQNIKGHRKAPTVGYGMPRKLRGLLDGMKPRLIENLNDLKTLGKNELGVLSSKLGLKKKAEIAKEALKSNLKFYNLEPKKFLEDISKMMEEKKKGKKETKQTETNANQNTQTQTNKPEEKMGKESKSKAGEEKK